LDKLAFPGSFQWQMVHECVEWFGDVSPLVTVDVGYYR
jgi:hypothetical protein